MPISDEDAARLPPMVTCQEVADRRRLEELKTFRKYLVDSGSIKMLVKLYQHTAKHEVRMDNPTLTKDFLKAFGGENPGTSEAERLEAENAVLRERNTELQREFERLTREVDRQQRLAAAGTLWTALTADDFWEAVGDMPAEGALTLDQVFRRLCGNKVVFPPKDVRAPKSKAKPAGKVLVDVLRPSELSGEALGLAVSQEAFKEWLAGTSEELQTWCTDELLPRLKSAPLPEEPPFERVVCQAVQDSALWPPAPHGNEVEMELVEAVSHIQKRFSRLTEFLQLLVGSFTAPAEEAPAEEAPAEEAPP